MRKREPTPELLSDFTGPGQLWRTGQGRYSIGDQGSAFLYPDRTMKLLKGLADRDSPPFSYAFDGTGGGVSVKISAGLQIAWTNAQAQKMSEDVLRAFCYGIHQFPNRAAKAMRWLVLETKPMGNPLAVWLQFAEGPVPTPETLDYLNTFMPGLRIDQSTEPSHDGYGDGWAKRLTGDWRSRAIATRIFIAYLAGTGSSRSSLEFVR